MTRRAGAARGAALAVLVVVACGQRGPAPATEPPRILVMTKTAGYRHASIPAGVKAIETLGSRHGFAVEATEDADAFEPASLAGFTVVVFLNTTGDILDPDQEAALEAFVRAGGGFVGVHAATDTEYGWAWYGRLVGARFNGHGPVATVTVAVIDGGHPSTRHLPARWPRDDEWYEFRDVSAGVHVLAERPDPDGSTHPTSWCHEFDGGRAWYTAGGHTLESYGEPLFVEHLLGGIVWAMGGEAARDRSSQALGSR